MPQPAPATCCFSSLDCLIFSTPRAMATHGNMSSMSSTCHLHLLILLHLCDIRFQQVPTNFEQVPTWSQYALSFKSVAGAYSQGVLFFFKSPIVCATSAGSCHLNVGNCLSRSHSFKTFRQLPCRICAQSTASEQMKLDFLTGSIWNPVGSETNCTRKAFPFRSTVE